MDDVYIFEINGQTKLIFHLISGKNLTFELHWSPLFFCWLLRVHIVTFYLSRRSGRCLSDGSCCQLDLAGSRHLDRRISRERALGDVVVVLRLYI